MREFVRILYFFQLFFMISCNNNSEAQDIDSFIDKYQNEDFSKFRGTYIAIRQKRVDETRYIVGKVEGNKPVYFVTYDESKDSIVKINRTSLQQQKIKDYFTDEEIKALIDNFRKYDFALLGVDHDGNVLINPFEINNPATLLRMNKDIRVKEIKIGYFFKHYKKNWYVRK